MTHLRRMMLEELQRQNHSDRTAISICSEDGGVFETFGKLPDQLTPDDLRTYQAYLLAERKLSVGTVVSRVAALRFFPVRAWKRNDFRHEFPYPKKHRPLPAVLSLEEVTRLIDAAGNLQQRAVLMILYVTGMRRTEVSQLKVNAIDSQRVVIRVVKGKGGHDRDLVLSPALLETLREYGRSKKPSLYLFPSSFAEKTREYRIRRSGTPVQKPPVMRVYANGSRRTLFATAGPLICWMEALNCTRFRYCSDTRI